MLSQFLKEWILTWEAGESKLKLENWPGSDNFKTLWRRQLESWVLTEMIGYLFTNAWPRSPPPIISQLMPLLSIAWGCTGPKRPTLIPRLRWNSVAEINFHCFISLPVISGDHCSCKLNVFLRKIYQKVDVIPCMVNLWPSILFFKIETHYSLIFTSLFKPSFLFSPGLNGDNNSPNVGFGQERSTWGINERMAARWHFCWARPILKTCFTANTNLHRTATISSANGTFIADNIL